MSKSVNPNKKRLANYTPAKLIPKPKIQQKEYVVQKPKPLRISKKN